MADDMRFQTIDNPASYEEDEALRAEEEKTAKMKRRRKLLLYGVAGLLAKIAVGFAVHHMIVGSHYVSTDNAYVDASTAQINAQVSGQILEIRVSDTQSVRAGDVLEIPSNQTRNIGSLIRDLYYLIPLSFAIMRLF